MNGELRSHPPIRSVWVLNGVNRSDPQLARLGMRCREQVISSDLPSVRSTACKNGRSWLAVTHVSTSQARTASGVAGPWLTFQLHKLWLL